MCKYGFTSWKKEIENREYHKPVGQEIIRQAHIVPEQELDSIRMERDRMEQLLHRKDTEGKELRKEIRTLTNARKIPRAEERRSNQ